VSIATCCAAERFIERHVQLPPASGAHCSTTYYCAVLTLQYQLVPW
jgi:hypothetical protein